MNAVTQPHGHKPFHVLKYAPQGDQLRKFHKSKNFTRVLVGPLGSVRDLCGMHVWCVSYVCVR